MKNYIPVIGIEVHLQLRTDRKAFCNCKNSFGDKPNTNICPICLGHPGTLPILNKSMVKSGIELSLLLGAKINMFTRFDRKNYFYPDCPKNYQITQQDYPIGYDGNFLYFSDKKQCSIKIVRVHLEEDSAKLNHIDDDLKKGSYIDYNRSGIPLIEIVTTPEFEDFDAVTAYLEFLKRTAKYLSISDCNMEEGSLRVDVNISLTKTHGKIPNYKVEIKNLNSFSAVKNSLEYEYKRQAELFNENNKPQDETRMWDEKNRKTVLMRKKETSSDYRYFPEPDIPPILFDEKIIHEIKDKLGVSPHYAINHLVNNYKFSVEEAYILSSDKNMYEYFLEVSKYCVHYKKILNWMIGDVLFNLRKKNRDFSHIKLTQKDLARIINDIEEGKITGKIIKEILPDLIEGKPLDDILKDSNMKVISSQSDIERIIIEILKEFPDKKLAYRNGKKGLFGFFMGEIMKRTKGKVDPEKARDILVKELNT